MATTVIENVSSREWQWNPPRAVFHYQVRGTSSDTTAKTALLAEAGTIYEGLRRDIVSLTPTWVDTVADDGLWDCEVTYIVPGNVDKEPLEVGESSFNFDTGGGTQHTTQSISTTSSYGTAPPDFKGAINVSSDGPDQNVDGVDFVVPEYTFSETHILADATVTNAYKGKLFALTGTVNDDTFKGTAAGECLFLGASGTQRGDGDWDITFRFAASPNRTGLTVGDISAIAKKGWEYMWVRYANVDDTVIVKQPVAVYIEKIYYDGSFSDLGIGV